MARAISVFRRVFEGRRWEMQLKGGVPRPIAAALMDAPCCASSVREFPLAQEFHAAPLGVPTSRSADAGMSRAKPCRQALVFREFPVVSIPNIW